MYLQSPHDPNTIIAAKENSSKYHRLLNEGWTQANKHSGHRIKHKVIDRSSLIESTQLTLTYLNVTINELHLSAHDSKLLQAASRCIEHHIKRLTPPTTSTPTLPS